MYSLPETECILREDSECLDTGETVSGVLFTETFVGESGHITWGLGLLVILYKHTNNAVNTS